MKNRYSIILLLILTSYIGKAQVKDISFTLSPAAEYTWWDDKSGLKDGALVGGKLGFGFGEYLELRGVYLQSIGLKTDFKDFGLQNYDEAEFNSQDVALTRWGVEFKGNIGTRKLKPYITLGAGIQKIEINKGIDFNQIYATAGIGMKFNILKRFVFALEAKNTTYMFDARSKLLSAKNQTDFDVNGTSFGNKRLYNWSVQGSLQFYLGGRNPGVLSDLDKAYLQKFKGGFKGLQFIIEPGIAYTDFDNKLLLRDTKWLGGYAGLNFNEYLGIRAFYFKATKDDKISIDFDDLSMYGAEFRARLNDGKGVVPFLILGGGYLDPSDDYVPNSNEVDPLLVNSPENGAFITGGLGLNIPLGKHVTISGGARAMMTSGDNVADISNIDDIQMSIFYNAGLKFTLGKKAKSPNTVYEESINTVLQEQQVRNDDKLIKEYQDKSDLLEIELKEAYAQRDVEKSLGIIEEKKIVGDALQEVKDVEKLQRAQTNNKIMEQAKQLDAIKNKNYVVEPKISHRVDIIKEKEEKLIKMTPIEFENLIDRIINGLDEDSPSNIPTIKGVNNSLETADKEVEFLKKRIEVIEKLLLEINAKKWINKN